MVDHSQRKYFCSVIQAFPTAEVIICALRSVVMMMVMIIVLTYHRDLPWSSALEKLYLR